MKCQKCPSERDAPIHRSSLYPGWHLFAPDYRTVLPCDYPPMPVCGTGEAMRAAELLEDDPTVDHEDVELGGEG